MTRKILFIIIGAVLFLVLLGGLWLWLIHRSAPGVTTAPQSGFGTSTDKAASTGQGGGQTSSQVLTVGSSTQPTSARGGAFALSKGVKDGTYGLTQSNTTNPLPLGGGRYLVSDNSGTQLGSFQIAPLPPLADPTLPSQYSFTPLGDSKPLTKPGNFVFTPIDTSLPPLADVTTGPGSNPNPNLNPNPNGNPTSPTNPGPGPTNPTVNPTQPVNTPIPDTTAPHVDTTPQSNTTPSSHWVAGRSGTSISERSFTPGDINQLNDTGGVGGTPLISTTPQAAGLGTSGLILGLTAAGCVATAGLNWAATQVSGALTGTAQTAAVSAVTGAVLVTDLVAAKDRAAKDQKDDVNKVWTCIVKSIAQAAIDQITRSVVNWINSGFNGQPSFVTNFNQYFANVADQAAGTFIKGSALSFLCSPISPLIKIAIAQSYAGRNNAASCTLTKIVNNINGFMRGSWGAGGWGGLIQFTTIPTNNPYGAYAYAQIGLNSQIQNAQNNANRNISPGGFISVQDCKDTPIVTVGSGNPQPKKGCKVTTPGAVIESALNNAENNPIQGLNLAQDINAIISALTNQIMIKTLYGGLGNAGAGITNPLAPAIDQAASASAQSLLSQLQTALGFAGQYGSVKQGAIADIQNTQNGLNTLYNCWTTVSASSQFTAAQKTQATQAAAAADTLSTQFDDQIAAYNNQITLANTSITTIQSLQSQVLFAATPTDVQSAANLAIAGNAQGAFYSQADVVTAQQDRATLQSRLTDRNQQIKDDLKQCRAIIGQSTSQGSLRASPSSGAAPLQVVFSGQAAGTSYTLSFGDGSDPVAQHTNIDCAPDASNCADDYISQVNETHTYAQPGRYTARLIVGDAPSGTVVAVATVLVQ
jgi:hypothetical protein